MKELKCPKCGTAFSVDDSDYAAILSQVKNQEFKAELESRSEEIAERFAERQRMAEMKLQQSHANELDKKQHELDRLTNEIQNLKRTIAGYDQLKDAQFESVKTKSQVEIERIKHQAEQLIHEKDKTITELKADIVNQQSQSDTKLLALEQQHRQQLKDKDDLIAELRESRLRLSTKMLGESLEIHCAREFARAQSLGMFPTATFLKDNDVSTGTKGDFIFRDTIDGHEYISVMFEMKNEADATVSKHRNEDFLEKLNKDRNDKNCEYAVLVSMLERDNEIFNDGIVDMSYRYPKMLVIRPQFLLPLLRVLTTAARRNLEYIADLRRQLDVANSQSVDLTKFEDKLNKFRTNFDHNVTVAHTKYQNAISGIDKVIADLEKQINNLRNVKHSFEMSQERLFKANQIVDEDFTIKKLTYGNPGMRQRFNLARQAADQADKSTDEQDA